MEKNKRKRSLKVLVISSFVALLTIVGFFVLTWPMGFLYAVLVPYKAIDGFSFFCFHDLTARQFEKNDWLAQEHCCGASLNCERLRMVKDLLSRYKLIGMTKQQIMDLLGDRYATSWAKGGFYDENSMNYCIGETTPWETLDPWYLCLKMDPTCQKVVEYTLWEQD